MDLTDQDIKDLRELEENLWRAETRFDREWMDEILAEDFFEFGRSGRVYTRAEILDSTPQEIPAVLPLLDFKVRQIDEYNAQVTYISIFHYESGEERGRRSSIWSRTYWGWRLLFHQGTAIPEDLWE